MEEMRRRSLLLLSLISFLVALEAAVLTFRIQNVQVFGSASGSVTSDAGCATGHLPPGISGRQLAASDPCYRFEGYRVSKPMAFCVNPDGRRLRTPLIDYVQQALDTWNRDTGLNLPITVQGTCPGAQAKVGSGLNVIAWAPLSDGRVGYTTVKYRHGTAEEAVVTLESSPHQLPESCLEAVLLHEMGHVLGLEHQPDSDSIMKPATDCPADPSPSPRDVAAVQLLYGASPRSVTSQP